MNRAVFLDRDGTIIEEKGYLRRPEDVAVYPGAADALGRLGRAGFRLILVTNQSGVGRGYYGMADVEAVHGRLRELLRPAGVWFDAIYIAPEAPGQPSAGRKPSPHFLWAARDEFGLSLAGSYMVGDKRSDLESGWNAGVRRCVLVRTGYGAELERSGGAGLERAVVVDDVAAAAAWILKDSAGGGAADPERA
ncbi:MAG: HAD family hydrolase [Verrucomicrobia bacterium]|nr:HAD family hydrolase [Verrucomicrobiota bacterium]